MRRAQDLLTRFLVTLALIVAALPLRANAEPCAFPLASATVKDRATCAMPCCERKVMAVKPVDCCAAKSTPPPSASWRLNEAHVWSSRKDAKAPKVSAFASQSRNGCRCELGSAPPLSPRLPAAFPSSFDPHAFVAILAPYRGFATMGVEVFTPGIVGVDSGPPRDVRKSQEPSRAPPVVRA